MYFVKRVAVPTPFNVVASGVPSFNYNQLDFIHQDVLRKKSRCPHPIQCCCQRSSQFQLTQVGLSSQELWIPASVGLAATML